MKNNLEHTNDQPKTTEAQIAVDGWAVLEELGKKDSENPQRKTLEEKAKEKNYYKNEDGVWMMHFDDDFGDGFGGGFDEKVEWFKLDEEYPDLAEKTEALADKYHVRYGDCGGLKKCIYMEAGRLENASDEHLEDIFSIAGSILFSTGGTEEILVGYESEDLSTIDKSLSEYYGATASRLSGEKLSSGDIMRIAECFVRNFDQNLLEGDFLDKLAEYSANAFSNPENKHKLISGITNGIEGIHKSESSGQLFGEYMEYASELVDDKEKVTKYDTRFDVFTRYVRGHGISEGTVEGFKNIIFPLMEQNDTEVAAILYGGNAYGTIENTYGVADYAEECLLSRHTPKDIDRLIRIYHEIPTSNYKKFEQNRKDAARLQGTIIGGRDFIHDERIGTNEVLSAIKDFYEHREDDNVEEYKKKLEELEEKYRYGILPYAFNLEAYEKPIEYMSDHNVADEGNPNERAIDILNRLVENTRPNLLEIPETKFPELNELMNNISPLLNEQTGEVRVDVREVGAAIAKMNNILTQKHNEQGVMPSTISAIAFLDKMAAYALRNTDSKDIQGLAFDPNFKEIVRFAQLTSSTEYNEQNFEGKYQQITKKISEAYGGDSVDKAIVADGYRILSQNILSNMQALGKNYASKRATERFTEAIWSGNLNDELIGLFQRV